MSVLAPLTTSDEKIEEVLKAKQYQIFSKLAKWKELNHGKVNKEYVNGQSFLYLGRNYRLSLVDNQDIPLKLTGGYFHLDKNQLHKAEILFNAYKKTSLI